MAIKPTDYVVNVSKPGVSDYPKFWQNFRAHIHSKIIWSKASNMNTEDKAIEAYLIGAGIKYKRMKNYDQVLICKDEADFLMFKLKWI